VALVGATRASGSSARAKGRAINAITVPPAFNGVFAYASAGRIVHQRMVGLADIEDRRPVTAVTRFRWGSATKWLVSVAVLRLAEQGRLSLDAPIAHYLPEVRRDTGDRVRVVHLLSNTSGLPDLLTRQVPREPGLRTSRATAKAMVARFGDGDLMFVPGTGWDYAALNWVIVAAIVERLTGEALPRAVSRLVLAPLGMTDTGFDQADEPAMPDLAAAYTDLVPPTRKMAIVPPALAANGNVASTAADAARAAHGIFHGRLLRPESRQALTTIHWPGESYALGGRVRSIDGNAWAWEAGKVGGYRALIAHRLARSETIVAFNTTDIDQGAITAWVETIARA